jgi:hypothetical protein
VDRSLVIIVARLGKSRLRRECGTGFSLCGFELDFDFPRTGTTTQRLEPVPPVYFDTRVVPI